MVQEASMESSSKKVHPFFSKAPPADVPNPAQTDSHAEPLHPNSVSTKPQRKRRKKDSQASDQGPGQKKKPRRSERGSSPAAPAPTDHDANSPTNASDNHSIGNFPTPPLSDISTKNTEQPLGFTTTSAVKVQADSEADCATPVKSKKVLKWNPKTGTLGSPPKPKTINSNPSGCLVTVKYGHDDESRKELGDKITQILNGKVLFPPAPAKYKKAKVVAPNQDTESKVTHPFFTDKAMKGQKAIGGASNGKQKPSLPSKHSVFMSTPVSPTKPRNVLNIAKVPKFGIKSNLPKIPGASHPLWPPKDMAHVRGLNSFSCAAHLSDNVKTPRKSKGSVVAVSPETSLLHRHCKGLSLGAILDALPKDNDKFEPAPKELRIPKRCFESGRKLQKRVRSQLRTYRTPVQADDEQDQDESTNPNKRTHPAIKKLYEALETGLSAYDRSTCENQTWAHKYAPTTASQVLQAGKEAQLLKEWLQALRVQSVDTGTADGGNKGKSRETAPRKKRKKDKLDGFIVDSEEEANFMDEVSEDDEVWAPAGLGLLKKTVIRSGDAASKGSKDQKRLTNAVVISGPHGSGKTAAVYAVAKELGFEIFEINSGSKRSGKDLLDKVGDMTRNHLVQQHHADQPADDDDDVEDEVTKDLKSGKQGMMTAFFKPKPTAPLKKPAKKAQDKEVESEKQTSTKNQKQSLILLEEVDVLYEEDKQFWATLMGMISQSKRPFIMTCNDESLVPLQSLSLHGIFRFSPPPISHAVDLCLLVAANEGHVIQRSAVHALYKCRNNDLRATLTELNYWCQIGVGDRRGGFDWFVLRWPKGIDMDENGDVIRVVSEGTYSEGMGWIGRDLLATCPNPLEKEEEVMKQSWDSWSLDLGDWHSSMDLESWADNLAIATEDTGRQFDTLSAYEDFCDALSSADILAKGAFGTGLQEQLDTTVPEILAKTKDDFIIGRTLLDAYPKADPNTPQMALSLSLRSLARSELLRSSSASNQSGSSRILRAVDEDQVVPILDASFDDNTDQMTRMDLAIAFDPIAVSDKATPSSHLDPSVFDRTLKLIVLDVAPWVRGIVEFDNVLMQERIKLSNLLSEGGKRKRMRTTRSAYSALEGGERRATRRERYFGDCLNTEFVRRTAGEGWKEAVAPTRPTDTTESIPSSPPVSDEEIMVVR